MIWRLPTLAGALLLTTAAFAQVPPRVTDMAGAPAVTPLGWKHKWLAEPNTSWDYVAREGRPLVMNLPGAPAEYANGLDIYLWRLFYDEGYALGELVWRDDRAQRQSIREDIGQIRSQVAEVRAQPAKFGGFDPDRIVIAASGADAFPAALLAFDSGPRGSSPVCAAVFIEPMNLDPGSPETVVATRKFSEDSNPAELAPARFAGNAPPTLLMTEIFDRTGAQRADALAGAIRASGGIAVRETYSRFVASDPRTYLGYSADPSTKVIRDFLKAYCPAKAPKTPQP